MTSGFGGGFTEVGEGKAPKAGAHKPAVKAPVPTPAATAALIDQLHTLAAKGGATAAGDSVALQNLFYQSGLPGVGPCLLANWIGGARSKGEAELLDFSQTAESVCGADVIVWGAETVESALADLSKISAEAGKLAGDLGAHKTKKSQVAAQANADEDAKKIVDKAKWGAGGAIAVAVAIWLALTAIAG